MQKIFLLLTFLFTTLYGCATCMVMQPMTDVNITLYGKHDQIERIGFDWRFNALYSSEVMVQFDDGDGVLDPNERDEILGLKLEYMQPRGMLTEIHFAPDANQTARSVPVRYGNFALNLTEGHLTLTFDGWVDVTVRQDAVFTLVFRDDGGFFDFRVRAVMAEGLDFEAESNPYLFAVSTRFVQAPSGQSPVSGALAPAKSPHADKPHLSKGTAEPGLLGSAVQHIRRLLNDIKTNHSTLSFALLLLFAYLYGLIHALGPGHGKTLVGSYFLSNDRSYVKAASVSLLIGVVHTFSALLLTLVVFFALNTLLSRVMDDVVRFTTIISALIIIAIALWLLYTKVRAYRKKPVARFYTDPADIPTPHASSCSCRACELDHRTTDIALIVSAGIIPCPGTVTLFIFALSQGLYGTGFLAAVTMSLGMSTIIFASAAFSVTLRRSTTQRVASLKPLFEYGSLGIILVLGVALLVVGV